MLNIFRKKKAKSWKQFLISFNVCICHSILNQNAGMTILGMKWLFLLAPGFINISWLHVLIVRHEQQKTSQSFEWKIGLISNQSSYLQAYNFIKKRLLQQCFLVNTAIFLRISILRNICERLLLLNKRKPNFSK